LSNKNPDARYRECSDTYTLKYKWKSLIPDKPVVTIDLYYPYYGQWRAPSGYSFPVNISSGVHEDSDIAVAFEYCDLHMDEWNSIGGWHYLDTYRERFFDVYMQKKEDGQDFHMDNFKEIPNMHVLRNLVYNQLDFHVTQNYYGEYLYTLSGAASGPEIPGEKIPIISFYKLDFS
jgi:hypothetical protein